VSRDENGVRRRLRPPERRAQIIDAARRVIAELGLTAATVREIADAADVRPGTITHHFTSTEALLSEVLRSESDRFAGAVEAAIAGRASAMAGLRAIGDVMLDDRPEVREHWRIWLHFWCRASNDGPLAEAQARRYERSRDLVRRLISEGVERGELAAADPDSAATAIVALVDGLAIQAFLEPGPVTPGDARQLLADALAVRFAAQAGPR
jgi:AcrR family transcriptional regulator